MQLEALCDLDAHPVDVVDEEQESDELLPALLDAELGGLLHGVDGVASGVGKTDHLRLRSLCLQQERREVRRAERMLGRAEHLAAMRLDVFLRFRFDALAQRVVDRQKIPVLAAAR